MRSDTSSAYTSSSCPSSSKSNAELPDLPELQSWMVLVHFSVPSVSNTLMAFSPTTATSGCPSWSRSAMVGAPPQPFTQPPGMSWLHNSVQSSSSKLTLPLPDTTISP